MLLNPKFNKKTNTFTAYADWSYGPLENGITRQEYKIVFSKDLSQCTEGRLRSLNVYNELMEESKFGEGEEVEYNLKIESIRWPSMCPEENNNREIDGDDRFNDVEDVVFH